MSTNVRPSEYTRKTQMLTPQPGYLAENINANLLQYISIAPPAVREFETDRNLLAEQPGGDAVVHPDTCSRYGQGGAVGVSAESDFRSKYSTTFVS